MGVGILVRKRPVMAYLLLTFAISWGGVLVLGWPHGMPAKQGDFAAAWPVVFLPYLMGPHVSALVLTGVVHGRGGYRRLGSRLVRWRVAGGYLRDPVGADVGRGSVGA
jgi:uncharacterized protein